MTSLVLLGILFLIQLAVLSALVNHAADSLKKISYALEEIRKQNIYK